MAPRALERSTLVLLGLPALGLTLAVTLVSTYLPLRLGAGNSPLVIGALLGLEGVFALLLPPYVGAYSDRTSTRIGDRLGLCLLAALAMTVALLALALSISLLLVVPALVLLYTAYFTYLAPYWALFPTLVPPDQAARAGSAEGSWRLIGSGLALILGGALYALASWSPFVAAAALLVAATGVFHVGMTRRVAHHEVVTTSSTGREFRGKMRDLLRDRSIRDVLVANALWNAALAVIRTFVVLFFVEGLGRGTGFVSGVVFPIAALGFVLAPFAGTLADRIGLVPVVLGALVVYTAGCAVPLFTAAPAALLLAPAVAAGAATVMTLPLAMLIRLLPEGDHGAASGLFGASRGIGCALGPLLAGGAIVALRPVLEETDGYVAMWPVTTLLLLASIPLVLRLRDDPRMA
jgi:Na+/melibiose symporter-like transporter